MKRNRTLMTLLFGFGSLVLLASGAGADWLVTSDGSKVEIEGPWNVEGKLVTFTLSNGTLGSMPLSAVDLEASRALAARVAEDEEPAEEPTRPKAVMVITDADVGHPVLPTAESTEEGEPSPVTSQAASLRVTGWREDVNLSRNSVEIRGSLQNPTANPATSLELDVLLYDDEGQLLETSPARLEQGFLNPGASLRFEALFEETLSFDSVDFDIRSRGFLSTPPVDEPPTEDDEEEGDDS